MGKRYPQNPKNWVNIKILMNSLYCNVKYYNVFKIWFLLSNMSLNICRWPWKGNKESPTWSLFVRNFWRRREPRNRRGSRNDRSEKRRRQSPPRSLIPLNGSVKKPQSNARLVQNLENSIFVNYPRVQNVMCFLFSLLLELLNHLLF